jgi:hypothetical protein
MCMKTSNLTVLTDDVDENKPLNTRSAFAQRAMLSGFIGNSLLAATRVYLAKRRLEAGSARAPLRPAGWRMVPPPISRHCPDPLRQKKRDWSRQSLKWRTKLALTTKTLPRRVETVHVGGSHENKRPPWGKVG